MAEFGVRADVVASGAPTRLYAYVVSELSKDVSDRIFAGSGCFLGAFEYSHPRVLAWRDHDSAEPWEMEEVAGFIVGE